MSIRLLEHLRDELIQTGIVTNTPEFCRSWLGRSEGYIRVLRYNRIDPSVETLTICSNKLGYYAARGCCLHSRPSGNLTPSTISRFWASLMPAEYNP